jgi:hypothetical protein
MKKILLALLILGAGAIASARLSLLANQSRTSATKSRAECARLTSQMDELAATATDLRAQVEAKKTQLAVTPVPAVGGSDAASALSGGSSKDGRRATPAELLRRLGIGWNSSADYVLVSKAALKAIYLRGIDEKGVFTPTACGILALTPAERATIEAAFKRAEAEHTEWVKTAVQRVEPAGDIVADYRLPANPNLAERIKPEGEALLSETLGSERAGLIPGYAGAWLFGHGNLGATAIRFTVRRHPDGQQSPLWWQIEGGNSGSSDKIRSSDFPDVFRPIFPGGWRDLAQREGFALPDDFE